MNARMKCKICGNDVDNKIHVVKERILNKGDSFHYLECSKCGTWMMIDEINNLSQFYPDDYNPFKKNRLKPSILKKAYRYIMIRKIFNSNYSDYRKVASIRGIDALIKRCCGIRINKQSKILDIGCAKGEWLDDLYDVGYHNITGIDLFIPEEKMRNKRWRFIHGDIFSITDSSYDLITLNHSLEHMQQNPKDILLRVKELLNIGSYCMICIPLGGGAAHRMFGVNFCQLDAPRHIYLLSQKAMKKIISDVGLQLEYINYDSHGGIFSLSDGFKRTDKCHEDLIRIQPSREQEFLASESNKNGTADQAIFIIKKCL